MTHIRRFALPALGLLTVVMLSAVACGDGDDGNSAEEDSPNDASAGICIEGSVDCDDTVDNPDEPTRSDDTPAATAELCADATACEQRSREIALRDLAAQLGVEVEAITVVSSEAVAWPDACLGVSTPGIACAEVITPGFKIVLRSGDQTYEYHTDMGTRAVLLEQPTGTSPAP